MFMYCSRYSLPEATKLVENHRELVSLHSSRTHITLLSSNSALSLSSLGLSDCTHVARVSDIVNSTGELSNYHTIMRRSTQSLIGVHWFQSYVSYTHPVTSVEHHFHALMCSVTVVFIHMMEDDRRMNTLVHEDDTLHFHLHEAWYDLDVFVSA